MPKAWTPVLLVLNLLLLGGLFFFLEHRLQNLESQEAANRAELAEMIRSLRKINLAKQETPSTEKTLSEMRDVCEKIMGGPSAPERTRLEKTADQLAEELVNFGNPAITTIVEELGKPGPFTFRRRILFAVGKIDRERGFSLANEILHRQGEEDNLRAAAAAAMKETDAERAEPILYEFLLNSSSDTLPSLPYIVETIQEIGTQEAKKLLLKVALDPKRAMAVRHRAVDALGYLEMVEAFPHLEQMASEDANGYLRRNAARALVKIDPGRACPFLRELTTKEIPEDFKLFLADLMDHQCR